MLFRKVLRRKKFGNEKRWVKSDHFEIRTSKLENSLKHDQIHFSSTQNREKYHSLNYPSSKNRYSETKLLSIILLLISLNHFSTGILFHYKLTFNFLFDRKMNICHHHAIYLQCSNFRQLEIEKLVNQLRLREKR